MPNLWVPGAEGPLDQFVERLHRAIAEFARAEGIDEPAVEVELHDGALLTVKTISPEPGFGFVTITPHPEDESEPQVLIVPLGSIQRITVGRPEPARARFGFSLPAG